MPQRFPRQPNGKPNLTSLMQSWALPEDRPKPLEFNLVLVTLEFQGFGTSGPVNPTIGVQALGGI
jgi:hypothetical protein